MYLQHKKLLRKALFLILAINLTIISINAQRLETGTISGRVTDSTKALILGAEVTVISAAGTEKKAQTNQSGEFSFTLPPGKYTVRVSSPGFSLYENTGVDLAAARNVSLDIPLNVAIQETQVTVADAPPVSTSPEANAGAVVLNETDIKALPSDSSELDAALQALAGPGAGPNGGEIFVDGFTGAKLPPRDSIKEIRINQNPFSSEYSRMGLGRIEIITKPGSDKWRGELVSRFEDESFNSRNPYATNRPPFQVRSFEGNLGGPLIKKRASFFLDAERKATDNNSLINARILDSNLNVTTFQQAVLTPSLGIEINPRVDFQINERNSLTVRFGYERDTQRNGGLGGFDLPSRAFNSIDSQRSIRLTEAAVISPKIINEFRIQFVAAQSKQNGGSNLPTIVVNDAFTSGGANVGQSFSKDKRFEITNNTSFILGKNVLKTGFFVRRVSVSSSSPANFAGTFTFASVDQYRNTLLNLPGAYPTQFSIAGGNPQAGISVVDYAVYSQDDWSVKPSLTLSFGLRYENQTGVSDNANFAPRVAFAYAPGATGQKSAKTVFRGGFGMFYERFGRNLLLQAQRFNGVNQQQYIITDPSILDPIVFTSNGVSNIPTIQNLSSFALPQTIQTVAPALQIPVYYQSAFSVERQLPYKTTVSLSYVSTAIRRQLRSRNINAPVNGVRPQPGLGNIFQYESTGRYNQNQLLVNFKSNFSKRGSFFGNYSFGGAKSDTEGQRTFPANSYDLSDEYGNASQDIRHRFTLGGSYTGAFGIRLSPLINYRSGVPFNITTGIDSNGDTLFTERPTFTQLSAACASRNLTASFCVGSSGTTIIPRNYGRGSDFFAVNLNAAKEFGIGGKKGAGGKDDDEAPYKLELSVQIRNLFNRTNKGTPIGNLRSAFFGDAVSTAGNFGGGGSSTAGNRRITFEAQFSF